MQSSQGQDAAAERLAQAADPGYEVEHSAHRPLPPEPASPSARAPTHPTRIELPRGRRICLAVTHDACAPRVVRYAAKLLLKSPEDRVHLLHVQQKGHCPKGSGGSGGTPTLTPYGSAGGMSLLGSGPLPSLGLNTLRSGPVFAAPPATPEEQAGPGPGSYERTAALPPGQPMSPRHSLPPAGGLGWGLGSPAGGSMDMGSWGSGGGFQTATSGFLGSPPAAGHAGQEACEQLLERCRLQLLGESRRVRPDCVAVRLLPMSKSPEKCIRNYCKQERCDILVVGCRGHAAKSKLLSFIGQGGGSVGAYLEGHLPEARVVVLPTLHG